MKSHRLVPVTFILFALILAALPSASADPMVETSIPDITIEEDNDALGIFNLNEHFSSDNGELDFSAISPDNKFAIMIHDDGLVDITTPEDWFGTDEVTFTATDGNKEARDTVVITVLPVNDRPYICAPLPEEISFPEDGTADDALNLHAHFADVDSNLVFSHSSDTVIVGIAEDGDVGFRAPSDWYGTETVTFSASDGSYDVSDTMMVTVVPVNDPPVSTGSPGTISLEGADQKRTIDLDGYFTDIDDETLEYEVHGGSDIGFEIIGNENLLVLHAVHGFQGEEVLTVTARDSSGAASSVQVMVVASGRESSSGMLFYTLGLVLGLAIAGVRLYSARNRRPPKSPVKLENYRHFRG